MDSNLINIDDLVRQRLSGGEERERSGAWLRMQELLEEENKRKPLGYWKNTMAYVGILLLLAAVTAGGYKASNAFRGIGNSGAGSSVAAVTGNENSVNENSTGDLSPASQSTKGAITTGNQQVNQEGKNN